MKKVLGTILFVVYAIIAITVTVLLLSYNDYNNSVIGDYTVYIVTDELLSYNDYNNSVIGDYTVYIVTDDSLEPEYKQGSILLIKGTNDRNVQVGDELFIYKVLNSSEYEVISTTLQAKTQQGSHTVYIVDNEESYASDYFIGKVDDTIVIEGWGYILSLLESRWGYLFCIVVVSLLLFLQEVFELVMEIKYLNQQKKKAKEEAEAEDEYDEDEYDEDEEYEEEEVVAKPRKTTRTTKKTSPKTATRASTRTKTATASKAGTTKKAGTTSKASTARKTSTTRKTATTTTRKPKTTK